MSHKVRKKGRPFLFILTALLSIDTEEKVGNQKLSAWKKSFWRMRASIRLPRACEARALPFELIPRQHNGYHNNLCARKIFQSPLKCSRNNGVLKKEKKTTVKSNLLASVCNFKNGIGHKTISFILRS